MKELDFVNHLNKSSHFAELFVGFGNQLERMTKLYGLYNSSFSNYPPSNIKEIDEKHYQIELAVAGFVERDFNIFVKDDVLTVEVAEIKDQKQPSHKYIFKGIGKRSFTKRFVLSEHATVSSAKLENGLLTIDITVNTPESKTEVKIPLNKTG